jgi:hypothetical protein
MPLADLAYSASGLPYLKRNPRVFRTALGKQFRYNVSVFDAPRNVFVSSGFVLLLVSISHLKDAFVFTIVLGRYGREIRFLARQKLPKNLCPFELFILEVNVAIFVYGNCRISDLVLAAIFPEIILLV